MLVIKFSIYNQRLRRITSGIIPSNAYGKLKFEFDFRTDDWDRVQIKTANFYHKGGNYPIELDENNQCFVPKEVIYSPSFQVSIHGGDIITNGVINFVEDNNTTTIHPNDKVNSNGFEVLDGGTIATEIVKNPVEEDKPSSDENNSSVPTGIVFVPSINEDKILSWTISESGADVKVPDPVDLNPFDEWSDDGDVVSEYEWEDDF